MVWRQGSSPAFGSWAYTHNDRGQRTGSTDITGRSAAYGYDVDSRLASETITSDPRGASFNGALFYVLDGAGNRLSRTSSLPAIPGAAYSYNANDELGSDIYDANGNTLSADGYTYAYDFENRLVSKDGGAVTLQYNCDGDRIAKTVGAAITKYLVDDLNPTGYLQVLEEVVGGAVQTRYTYGTNLVSQTRNASTTPTTSYYGHDAHGNVTFLTDAAGSVIASYDYDACGILVASIGTTPNSRRYVGEEFDADLGLINLRARVYEPGRARFLTSDPFDVVSGAVSIAVHEAKVRGSHTLNSLSGRTPRTISRIPLTDPAQLSYARGLGGPQDLHRYAYVANDPTNRSDPSGLGNLEYAVMTDVTTQTSKVAYKIGATIDCEFNFDVDEFVCGDILGMDIYRYPPVIAFAKWNACIAAATLALAVCEAKVIN